MRLAVHGAWLWALLQQLWQALAAGADPRLPAPAASRADENLASRAGRCLACGACDAAFDAWSAVPRDEFLGPMHFVLRARSGPGTWRRLTDVHSLVRGDLEKLERVCPAEVPFVSLARAIQAKVPPPKRHAPSASEKHDPG